MNSAKKYALVTPSFRLDVERCALLVESVNRWVAPGVRHYLVIDRRDVTLFKGIATPRTEILVVEDIVPNWLIRVPGIRRFWLSLRSRPVKNWILQQIVKLSIAAAVSDDVLLYTDSDVFFIAPYDPRSFEREGLVPLFVEYNQRGKIPSNDRWHAAAAKMLGLPAEPEYDTNFIGNVICWQRANVLAIHRLLEEVAGKRWELALAPLNVFSEYILYGLFASRIAANAGGHWQDDTIRTLNYWPTVPLDRDGLEKLKAERTEHQHSVMVSAKSRTPVTEIRKVFF